MLANENMSIEGMTTELYNRLNLQTLWIDHNDLRHLSLILLMPQIIKYSIFNKFLNEDNQETFGIEK